MYYSKFVSQTVVYKWFFVETGPATQHSCDVILHALVDISIWVNARSLQGEGEWAMHSKGKRKKVEYWS